MWESSSDDPHLDRSYDLTTSIVRLHDDDFAPRTNRSCHRDVDHTLTIELVNRIVTSSAERHLTGLEDIVEDATHRDAILVPDIEMLLSDHVIISPLKR